MELEMLQKKVASSSTIHIFGAGLNSTRPAHTAVKELSDRGFAVAPVHPKDAGATIEGFPIRPQLDEGVLPEIVVLFLAPERARVAVRKLMLSIERENFPLIWLQPGAGDEETIEALTELGVDYVQEDCIVRFCERHSLECSNSMLPQKWCLQVRSPDEDGCSVWSVHSTDSASFTKPASNLEWVGSLDDLKSSNLTIPRYIRSLKQENESITELAIRLSN